MAAYRRVYDSRHLQADCQEPGSAPGPYARQSSMGYTVPFTFLLESVLLCVDICADVCLWFCNLPVSLHLWWSPVATLTAVVYGEMTSQKLWSRYVRHFVGITWRNMWS